MPHRVPLLSRLPVRLVVLLLLLRTGAASAQMLPTEGSNEMESQYRTKYREKMALLRKGQAPVAENAEAIDFAAKWAIYRFTWLKPQTETMGIDRLYVEFDNDLTEIEKSRPASQPFADAFTKQVLVYAPEVLKNNALIARVNVARVLARLARTGQEELADVLADAVADPKQNDGVKYWALRGLGELFTAVAKRTPPAPMSKEREQKAIQVMVDFVQRKAHFLPNTPRDEIEGFKVLRREGIRALAQTRVAALSDKTRPALVLLKIVVGDGYAPDDLRTDERVEAAIGVARMRPDAAKQYQPDYAAFHLANFIADDLHQAHLFNVRFNESKAKEKPEDGYLPWKIIGARLSEALQGMKAETKDPYVAKVVDQTARNLADMELGKPGETAAALIQWLSADANQPPNKTLFKGAADTEVKPGEKAAPAPPEKTDIPKEKEKKDVDKKDKDKDPKGKDGKKDGKDK